MGADIRMEVAELRHVHLVASRMRKGDRDEVQASGGFRPAPALRRALQVSQLARTVFIDGEAAFMFGVSTLEPDSDWAVPWLLSTDTVDRYPVAFLRATKALLAEVLERYPQLVQFVDTRYTQSLAWVERLGFKVGAAMPFGFAGRDFHPITLRA